MATFNYILGPKKNDGRYPIYLKICNGKTNTMRSMDISVAKSEWNNKGQRISIRRTDTYEVRSEKEKNNEFLDLMMVIAKKVENTQRMRGVLDEMSAKDLMTAILEYSPNTQKVDGSGDFVQYWYGVMMETPKSQTKYQYAIKAIINFHIAHTGTDRICFKDITTDWVRGCLAYLKHGYQYAQGKGTKQRYKELSPWSLNTYASCLKKVLNCAIDSDKLSADVMRGFRNFKPNIVNKDPFYLTIEDLRELQRYPFKTMRQRMVRDLFIFSFCTMGMNLTDIYHLNKKEVKWSDDSGDINYIRNKTSKPIRVEICSYAQPLQELIKPYLCTNKNNIWNNSSTSNYYFGFHYNYPSYKDFSGYVLKVIRQIRKIMNYDENFTFYTARDSWSSIANNDYQLKGIFIDIALGHSSTTLADKHYIGADYNIVSETHADMLQRLFEE